MCPPVLKLGREQLAETETETGRRWVLVSVGGLAVESTEIALSISRVSIHSNSPTNGTEDGHDSNVTVEMMCFGCAL